MGEIVNLNKRRKERIRREAAEAAARNRVLQALPKTARREAEKSAERRQSELDGKRLD